MLESNGGRECCHLIHEDSWKEFLSGHSPHGDHKQSTVKGESIRFKVTERRK